jgi:integrase
MAYFSVTWYEPGKERQQRTTVGKDETEAVAWARAKAEQLRRIQRTPKAERKFAAVAELVDAYLDPTNHRTWRQARTSEKATDLATKFLTPGFLALTTHAVTDDDVQKLLDGARRSDPTDARPLSRSYLADGRAFLTALIAFGVRQGYLEAGQLTGSYELPETLEDLVATEHGEDDEDADGFTVSRMLLPGWDRVRDVADLMPTAEYRLLVLFAAATGLRFGELAALRWTDIDLGRRVVRVRRKVSESNRGQLRVELPKGRKRREAVLPAWLAADVADRVAAAHAEEAAELAAAAEAGVTLPDHSTGLLFPAPRGGFLRRSNFHRRVWRPAHQAAGWRPGTTFHTLRHIAAVTLIYDLRVDLVDVAEALGHADVSVTQRVYVQAREGSAARVAAASASGRAPWA